MRVLFASAEYHPIATVGGLAAAAAGLVAELRRQGVEIDLVLPDYGDTELADQTAFDLDVPEWVSPASVRSGRHPEAGAVHLVSVPGIDRPHPYLQQDGAGWADNDARFLRFSRSVAALSRVLTPDVVHLNDWHTAAALADLVDTPSVLSIHNLAYQGVTAAGWLQLIGERNSAYEWYGQCNPFAGGLTLADRIIAVSPNYAREIREPEHGYGLDQLLTHRSDALTGILNGIDTAVWDPANDPHLPSTYTANEPSIGAGKAAARDQVLSRFDFGRAPADAPHRPLAIMVTRLTEQKGSDLLTPLAPYLDRIGLRIAILGSGERDLVDQLHEVAGESSSVRFVEGYDEALSHQMFAAADLLLMPSRFEPCGLTQLQALRYGALPVATAVGGLVNTVVDLDDHPETGNGWLADRTDSMALLDALHRSVRPWHDGRNERVIAARQRSMSKDYSWAAPAELHIQVYSQLANR